MLDKTIEDLESKILELQVEATRCGLELELAKRRLRNLRDSKLPSRKDSFDLERTSTEEFEDIGLAYHINDSI